MEIFTIALAVLAGVTLGTIAGVLPGFSAAVAIALLLPFTYALDVTTALCFLGGVFAGGLYGGSLTAITLRIPGAPGNIATIFDGYPLAKKGMAQEAVIVSAVGSALGGLLGVIAFMILTPVLANFALRFGPPELFWLAIFALSTLASMSSGNLCKGIISGLFGIMLGTVGLGPATGEARFVFGQPWLTSGIPVVIALIGFFSVGEALALFSPIEIGRAIELKNKKGILLPMLKFVFGRPFIILSSALIGIFVGLLPGTGGSVAGILAYNETKRWSKKRYEFGNGALEGVLAPEVANNATEGGSLIPLMSLGIPGSAAAAALMGALLLHGLKPGPDLFLSQGRMIRIFMVGLILAQFLLPVVGILGAKTFVRLLRIPSTLLGTYILCLSVVGAYCLTGTVHGVIILVFCGVMAYFMEMFRFPKAPAVIGLVLSYLAEYNFQISVQIVGDFKSLITYFLSRPITVILIILCGVSIGSTALFEIKDKKEKLKGNQLPIAEADDRITIQKIDIILCCGILLVCGMLFANTLSLKNALGRIFPQTILIAISVFTIILLGTSFIRIKVGNEEKIKSDILPLQVVIAIITSVAYIWTPFIVGYYLTTTVVTVFLPIVLTTFLKRVDGEKLKDRKKFTADVLKYFSIAVGFNFAVYLIFESLLGFKLPRGFLF